MITTLAFPFFFVTYLTNNYGIITFNHLAFYCQKVSFRNLAATSAFLVTQAFISSISLAAYNCSNPLNASKPHFFSFTLLWQPFKHFRLQRLLHVFTLQFHDFPRFPQTVNHPVCSREKFWFSTGNRNSKLFMIELIA